MGKENKVLCFPRRDVETGVQCGSRSTWERERKGVEGTAMAGGKGAENKTQNEVRGSLY